MKTRSNIIDNFYNTILYIYLYTRKLNTSIRYHVIQPTWHSICHNLHQIVIYYSSSRSGIRHKCVWHKNCTSKFENFRNNRRTVTQQKLHRSITVTWPSTILQVCHPRRQRDFDLYHQIEIIHLTLVVVREGYGPPRRSCEIGFLFLYTFLCQFFFFDCLTYFLTNLDFESILTFYVFLLVVGLNMYISNIGSVIK